MVKIDNIKTFSVIGAGTMGREIAEVALMAGFKKVILNDTNKEVLEKAENYIREGLKKLDAKGKLGSFNTVDYLMGNLFKELDLKKAVENSDFVVEAIPEIMELKQNLFKQLCKYAPEHAILTTNTSTISITEIASASGCPDRIVGMHFFIPVPVLRLIEVIKGKKTSEDTINICIAVGQKFPALKGKKFLARIEKESPGFIVNRLTITGNLYLSWLLDEAMEKGIPYEQIDADAGFLQGLGPYAKWDYLGLDVVYNTHKYLEENLSPEFAPGKTITKLVKEGNMGRKTGKGLYEWIDGNPKVDKTIKAGLFNPELFLAIQLNEGCRLLEEGIVSNYKIIDDAMFAGMDIPGPFGPGKKNYQKWSKMLEDLMEESGIQHFKPCYLMKSGEFLKRRK